MTNNTPLVTVIMTTYNHEKYVGDAIESVLSQTFGDLELVIVNDGSGDNTEKVVKKFTDERIVYIYQENQGPSIAANNAILASRGKYIAIMSGDDVSHPLRIERQLNEYQKQGNKRVLFSHCNFIDDDNNSLDVGHFAKEFFNCANKNRFEILNHYFWKGNFLNDITTFTEKEAFLDIGLYNPLFLQLQDFDLWMRALLKGYEFYIMPEKLISYRIRANNANLSAPSAEAIVRTTLENGLILRNYLQIKTQDDLLKIFPEVIKFNNRIEPDLIPFYVAQLSLSVPKSCHQLFGVETIFNLLNDPVLSVHLKEKVGFGHKEFCEITGRQDIFRLFHNWFSKLYVNTGNDYSEKEVVSQRINVTSNNFSLTFDLSTYSNIQSLRWDPMENYWCNVTIEQMYYLDKSGNRHSIDKRLLSSNGISSSNGMIVFETFDPNIFIPVQGEVKYFSIIGKWETISFGKVEESFREKYESANKLTTELKNIYGSRGWKALTFCNKLRERILPANSKRWEITGYLLNVILKKGGQIRHIYCHCDNPPHNGLGFYGDVSINGWAVATVGIDRVEIYCDHTFLGNATYGLPRPDVQKRYPSLRNSEMSGFHFLATGINIGKHTLTIKMVSSKGATKTIKRKIVINAHHTSQEEVSYAHSLTSFLKYTLSAARVWYRQKRRLPAVSELPTLVRKAVYKWRNERYLNSSPGYTMPKRLDTYTAWLAVNSWNEKKQQRLLHRLSKITPPPLLSVVMPVYNTPRAILEITIKSVVDQVYENWELCIADDASTREDVRNHLKEWAHRDKRISVRFRETNGNISLSTNTAASLANGDYLVFLDHDDELSPDALGEIALKIDESPDADIIYSDDDKIDTNGNRFAPQFKPDWAPELLLSYMYFSHIFVVRRRLFDDLGGMRVGFEGSQDYDFALRASEKARGIYHIPLVLYHWRVLPDSTASSGNAKPGSIDAGRRAVQDALDRRKIPAKAYQPDWAQKAQAGIFSHKYVLANYPSVSIIIPTKNQKKILARCIDSLIDKTNYPNYEILVIDNNSDDSETIIYLKELLCKPRIKVVTIGNPRGKFNYSFINNRAVEKTVSDYVLFLNNDTEVLHDNWLTQMVGCAQTHGVGAVGARLLYPDRRIQHAGVIIKFYRGLAGHAFNGLPDWNEGYLAYAKVLRNCTAVTAACLLTPRKLYLEMGGLDESNFGVAYNDVDYCCRLIEKGYRVVYTPEAELIHHEGFSRGFCDDIKENVNFRKKYYTSKDRFYNTNLSLENERFEIQPRCAFSGEMRKRLKVLLCTHNLNHEGAPYHLYEVAIGLKQKGIIEPIVFSYTDGPLRQLYEAQGIKVIVNAQLNNDFQTTTYKNRVSEFASFVEESGVDLVYGNTLLNFYVVAAARESGIPSLWNIHESEPWQHYVNWWGTELACEALKCFEYPYKVIFVAHATKSVYSAFNSKHNFNVIHNGLNLQRVYADADKTNRNVLRNELGVADDEVMILLPGTVCERKGQHDLAFALKKVNTDCLRKGKYFIVGDRPSAYSRKLHDIVDSLPVETKLLIKIIPETAEIHKYYKAADIFVCTSRIESFPRVILEAMTFNLPIITTPVFGIVEQVQEGVNAILYNPGDVEVLAKSIEKLIRDNELRRRLAGNSALVLQQLNSFEDMIDSYSKLIQEAYLSYPDKKYYTIFKRGKITNKGTVKKVTFLTTYIDENSQRYRVYNLIEELIQAGIECVVFKEDCRDNLEYVLDSDLLVAFRVGSSKNVMRTLNEFKKRRIPVVFDIDDLVFEPESVQYLDAVTRLDEERKNKYLEDMKRLKETLLASDYVTCTTASLSKRVELLNKKCFVFPNTINNQQYDFAKTIVREKVPSINEKIKIGYFSGTKTHEKDFTEVSDALYEILKKYTDVAFHLVGLLDLDEKFSQFRDRIVRKPLMSYLDMLGYVSQMDINLAPLELNNIFTDSKSELKIFEAALVSVPTIASATNTYKMCIRDGVNGFLAVSKSDWFEKLEILIQDKILREKIAEEAKKDFIQRFYIKNRINDIIDIYNRIIADFQKGVDSV